MHFVHATEQIVQVAHDVLISAHQEEAHVVRLVALAVAVRRQFMDGQGVAHVAQVDTAHYPDVTLYVGVTGADGKPVGGLAADGRPRLEAAEERALVTRGTITRLLDERAPPLRSRGRGRS